MDAGGAGRLNRSSPSCLNRPAQRTDFFHGLQGGETAFGGSEAVVVMTLDPEGRRFRYILLATNRTGTMQSEMNDAPPEYSFVGHDGVRHEVRRQ